MPTLAKLLVTLGLDSRDFDSGIDRASQKTSGLSTAVSAAASTAAVGLVAIGGAVAGAAYSGLQFNNSMEIVTAQLNAFTKDGAKTAAILDMIKTRAANTPFAFEDMAQAATALLPASKASGVALEDLIKKAEILGASNPAEGLAGAAFSLKEALSGDFTSIIERFNLPRQRLKELKDQGVPALEAVTIAMNELGLDADLVSNLANTASGRWSTFKDTMVGVASTITAPLFDALSGGLASVNTGLTNNQPLIDAFAQSLASTVTGAINSVAGAVSFLIELFSASGSLEQISVLSQIMPLETATQIVGALNLIGSTIQTILGTLGALDFGTIFDPLVTSAQDRINVLVEIVTSVFGIIQSVIDTYGSQIAASTSAAFTAVLTTVSSVLAGVNTVVNTVLAQVAAFIQTNGQDIANFIAETWLQIADIVKVAMDLINATVVPALAIIAGFISDHSAEIQTVLNAAWTIIKTVITTALDLIKTVITVALQAINGDWSGAWNTIQQFSARFVTALLQVFKSGLDLLKAAFNTAIDAVKATFQALIGDAPGLGSDIINGILEGLRSAGNGVISFLQGLASDALSAAKAALGISSPSRKFAEQVGAPIVQGIALGMERNENAITTQMQDLAGNVVNNAKSVLRAVGNTFKTSDTPKISASFGQSLLDGMIKGVQSRLSGAISSMQETARKLVSSVEKTLQIGSPSQVFADRVGVPVIMGIIAGMQKQYPQALAWIKGNLGKKLSEYLKTTVSFARGSVDIFKSLVELEKVDPYAPLAESAQAYQEVQDRAIELSKQQEDISKQIAAAEALAIAPQDRFTHAQKLTELYAEQARILDEQYKTTAELSKLGEDVARNQDIAGEQRKAIAQIAEEAAKAYEAAQKQALDLMKTDAKGALDFFNQRKAQIEELAELQKQRALATDPNEQKMLDTQIALVKAAQDAEKAQLAAELNIIYPGGADMIAGDRILKILQDALRANGIQVDLRYRTGG